jgi:hypothetical protein
LGRTAGSTRAERLRALPFDDLVPSPNVITDHAITIPAAPADIWPWLTQMGWHRGGWYTYRWVDQLLFPKNWPSADRLVPHLQRQLEVGDHIPDGPDNSAYFVVLHVDEPNLLVLRSRTHVPMAWRARFGARIDWVLSFNLRKFEDGTRLHLRTRGRAAPWWLAAGYVTALVPADMVMTCGMLHGIRDRVVHQLTTPPLEGEELPAD